MINNNILCAALILGITATAAHAATIYKCKTYTGGFYLSSELCSKTNGLIVDMAQVPDAMPFEKQAELAEQTFNAKLSAQTANDAERERQRQCGGVNRDLTEISNRYKEGKYVPIDQVNADQIRERDLEARRASLHCER
jgi:hypothetical protein